MSASTDLSIPTLGRQSPDLLVIGAGIFGLWAARHAIKAGKRVTIIDRSQPGAGASGGFLGALMPHMANAWNSKKQMQFEALTTLSDAVTRLEEETNIDCGYRRCGRVIPLVHGQMPLEAHRWVDGAGVNWRNTPTTQNLSMDLFATCQAANIAHDLLNPELTEFGLVADNFSARINPRATVSALASYAQSNGTTVNGLAITSIDADAITAKAADGTEISAGKILVACGYRAYAILQPLIGPLNGNRSIGRGVKGQAVLVEHNHNDEMPIIYHDGAYVIPHKHNRVAIGSTSHGEWHGAPESFDDTDMAFYEKAISMTPALKDAPIIEKWANVRPRNTLGLPWELSHGTEPFVGQVPGHDRIFAAIGGFKIGLGIAHHMTSGLVD